MKFKPFYAVLIAFVGLGILSIKITSDLERQALQKLEIEEQVAMANNQRIFSSRRALQDYENEKLRVEKDIEFNHSLYGSSSPPADVVQQQIERHLRKVEGRQRP